MPMTAMEGFSGEESCIFGHPKVQMNMVPVLDDCPPKKDDDNWRALFLITQILKLEKKVNFIIHLDLL